MKGQINYRRSIKHLLGRYPCSAVFAHLYDVKGGSVWWLCATCLQDYTGPMQLELATEWVRQTEDEPEEAHTKLASKTTLANA